MSLTGGLNTLGGQVAHELNVLSIEALADLLNAVFFGTNA